MRLNYSNVIITNRVTEYKPENIIRTANKEQQKEQYLSMKKKNMG